jgi:hypothetical protein
MEPVSHGCLGNSHALSESFDAQIKQLTPYGALLHMAAENLPLLKVAIRDAPPDEQCHLMCAAYTSPHGPQ